MKDKTDYLVSYITKSGCVLLNIEVKADSVVEATSEVRQSEDVHVVLSCVSVPLCLNLKS